MFTTDVDEKIDNKYTYYMDIMNANMSYKNNVLLYIHTINNISKGITIDDFYNNNISLVDIIDFDDIPDRYFTEFNVLVVWVDKSNAKIDKNELDYVIFLEKRLKDIKHLYLLNESVDNIANIILEYIYNEDKRQELIEYYL